MPLDDVEPVVQAVTLLVLGALTGAVMAPLHAALARRRRLALLVDRVVSDRISRLIGAERRRAWRHLHREAGVPALYALGLAVVASGVTLAATVAAASTVDWTLEDAREAVVSQALASLDDAGFPAPTVDGAVTASGYVLLVLVALTVAWAHIGALDVERRRTMPVTRPWPLPRPRAVLLTAAVVFVVLVASGLAVAAGIFLLGHQIVARWRRPSACRVAPVVPEALRAARLPVARERRLLRARRPAVEGTSGQARAPGTGGGPGAAGAAGGPSAAGVAGAAGIAGAARALGAAGAARASGAAGAAGAPLRGPTPVPPAPLSPTPAPPRTAVAAAAVTPGPSTRLIDLAAPEQPLKPHDPRTVGEYTLTGRLGSGGMGTVYLGHRSGTTGVVAIKVLAPHLLDDVDARTRFLREGRTLQQVTGDYTARIHGVGFDGSMPYIVMERLDGPSLHAFVCASGAVTDGDMLTRTAVALARALAALHADGITHRDLKPGNILLTSAGPKVVDFGIARVVGQTHHTPIGNMVGTPGYMAPEQVTGNGAGPASDVWAWACCVVFAARGDHLFDGENIVEIARRILDGPAADDFAAVARLSPRLVPVLRRATAQEAGDRPRDGAALLRLLDRSGAPASASPSGWDRLLGAGAR